MGIPIGRQYTTTITASANKAAKCEQCSTDYIYRVERQATGSGTSLLFLDNSGAASRSEASAREAASRALETAVDAVACPRCGWYQKNMVKVSKWAGAGWTFGILFVLAGLGIFVDVFWGRATLYQHWAIMLGVSGACSLLIYMAYDPNSGYRKGHGHSKRALASRGMPYDRAPNAQQGPSDDALQAELYRCLRQAMVTMSGIDGSVDPEELEAIARIYRQVTGEDVLISQLEREAEASKGQHQKMLSSLNCLVPYLQYQGKAMFVRAVLAIACADGRVDDSEWKLLAAVGASLEMNASQVDEIIEEMTSGA